MEILLELQRIINESKVPAITLQQAKDKDLFGPVYHGTDESGRDNIAKHGFKVIMNREDARHGYPDQAYYGGLPPPIHHLGYGVYFTTVKSIGKKFNQDSVKGLEQYYLDVPRLEVINFAAPRTMMKWWQENGYDFDPSVKDRTAERIRATKNMTDQLSSKYDAILFKGKTIHKVLDGNQICVFNPSGKVFRVDNSNVQDVEMGAKVKFSMSLEEAKKLILKNVNTIRKNINPDAMLSMDDIKVEEDDKNFWIVSNILYVPKDPKNWGTIVNTRDNPHGLYKKSFDIKWKKGGTQYGYLEPMLELYNR